MASTAEASLGLPGARFTWEHDAHLYLKRAEASELFLGDGSYHRGRLAARIGL